MSALEDARKLWLEEERRFEEYAQLVAERLRKALRPLGVWTEVTARAKKIDSVLKKLIKKPNHTYESLPDKAGVRIVTRYRSDLNAIVETVQAALHCGPVDWKRLEEDQVRYSSIHIDFVRLREEDEAQRGFPVNRFWVELQIRTLAQHLWSEMSHDSVYKNDETIQVLDSDVKRRVNLMAGQIEIADREFDRLGKETRAEDAAEVLRFLEPFYFSLSGRKTDVELSLILLKNILPLYNEDVPKIEERLQRFIAQKKDFLVRRFDQAQDGEAPPASALFFQPEMFILYERLSDDPTIFRRAWSEHFPDKELENLANDLGISFQ